MASVALLLFAHIHKTHILLLIATKTCALNVIFRRIILILYYISTLQYFNFRNIFFFIIRLNYCIYDEAFCLKIQRIFIFLFYSLVWVKRTKKFLIFLLWKKIILWIRLLIMCMLFIFFNIVIVVSSFLGTYSKRKEARIK